MSILLLPLIIIGLFVFINRVQISSHRALQVRGIYLVLLLISLIAFYTLAESSPSAPDPDLEEGLDEEERERYHQRIDEFYNAVYSGGLESYEGAEIVKEWDFSYEGDRLLLTTGDGNYLISMIVIERKDVDDGVIKVINGALSASEYSLGAVKPQDIIMTGNRMEIIMPEPTEIRTVRFFQDFTSAQFTGKGLSLQHGFHYYFADHQVLLLKIPKSLHIDTNRSTEHRVFFLDEL